MKSSFLLLIILSSFVTSAVYAQTKAATPKPADAPKDQAVEEKSSFQKFSDRLRMSYFSAFQSSSIGNWETSKAIDEFGELTTDPIYTFNQVSFNYNFGWKMNFVVNPRWTNWFGSTKNKGAGEDKSLFSIEDTLVGLQGVIYSSEDKKFNWWMRAGARLPTSRASRASDVTMQPEVMNIPSYDFNKEWQLGAYVQARGWVYNQTYTPYRYRLYYAPYIQYTVSDTVRLQAFYESYLENRKNWKSQNGKSPIFKEYWQDVMVGVSWDISPKVNFFPFLGYFVDKSDAVAKPLDPAWFGFWFSWQIK